MNEDNLHRFKQYLVGFVPSVEQRIPISLPVAHRHQDEASPLAKDLKGFL